MPKTKSIKKERKIIVVVGKTGSGKSWFTKHELLPHMKRVVIFDLQNEYNPEDNFDNSGYIIFNDVEDFREHLKEFGQMPELKIILNFESDDYFEEYELALRLCYIVGNMTCVIEEIWNFCSASYMNEDLKKLIRVGRHHSISIVGVTQRFYDISLLLRNNLDYLVCFNLTAPNDIKYLKDVPYITEKANDVPNLKVGEYIILDNTI